MNMMVNPENQKPFVEAKLNGKAQLCVNAREMHNWLGSKQDFSTWIKRRIAKYGFSENIDYLIHQVVEQATSGAKHKTEYLVTVDMAKELAMVECTPKGREVRLYYIEQENIARDALSGIQIEIGKLTALADQWTQTLSNAGRILSVGGKQVKPKIITKLNELIQQAQHKLEFDENH